MNHGKGYWKGEVQGAQDVLIEQNDASARDDPQGHVPIDKAAGAWSRFAQH